MAGQGTALLRLLLSVCWRLRLDLFLDSDQLVGSHAVVLHTQTWPVGQEITQARSGIDELLLGAAERRGSRDDGDDSVNHFASLHRHCCLGRHPCAVVRAPSWRDGHVQERPPGHLVVVCSERLSGVLGGKDLDMAGQGFRV